MRLIEAGFGAYKKTAPRKNGSLALFFYRMRCHLILAVGGYPCFRSRLAPKNSFRSRVQV